MHFFKGAFFIKKISRGLVKALNIGGFQKVTLKDYPKKIASICFLQGCQLRCPFCHNPDLVLAERFVKGPEQKQILKDFLSYIEERKNMLDGVVFTGGEPLLDKNIKIYLAKIKDLGLMIKLDTNGLEPEKLSNLIEEGLVDYVALDYKNNSRNFNGTTGIIASRSKSHNYEKWMESLKILDKNEIHYELRTTLVKELHSREDLILMAKELKAIIKSSNPKWYLQSFERRDRILEDYNPLPRALTPYLTEEIDQFKKTLDLMFSNVEIRN